MRNSRSQRALVPNMAGFTRDVTDHGPTRALLHRFRKLHTAQKVLFISHYINLKSIVLGVRKDFPLAIRILCELELLEAMQTTSFDGISIHEDIVDLALAFNNKRILTDLALLAKIYGRPLTFFTHNPSELHRYTTHNLRQYGIDIRPATNR